MHTKPSGTVVPQFNHLGINFDDYWTLWFFNTNTCPRQIEVSIPDFILLKDIKGVWQKQGGVLTTWIPNHNYKP